MIPICYKIRDKLNHNTKKYFTMLISTQKLIMDWKYIVTQNGRD